MRFLVLLFFILQAIVSNAQDKGHNNINIDSTFEVTKALPNDKSKVTSLLALYNKSIKQHQINDAIIQEALKVATKIYDVNGLANTYNKMGVSARYNSEFGESVNFHKRALSFYNQTTDTLGKIKCLNSLGVSYRKLNLEKDAFTYYFKALKFANLVKNNKSKAISLNGIGNVFINTGEYDKALYYFEKALEVEKILNRKRGERYDLANIGEVYMLKGDYDKANDFFQKALALTKPNKNNIELTLLGQLNQKKGNYEKSIAYYQGAISKLTAKKNKRYLSNALINLGKSQIHLQMNNEGFQNINKGLAIASEIGSKENIVLGYNALVSYYEVKKNYKKALKANKTANIYQDSIINEASQKSIISTQIAYETDIKDKEIQKLALAKKQNLIKAKRNYKRMLFSIAFGVLAFISLLVILYLYHKNADLEMQNLNSELQSYVLKIEDLKTKMKHDKSVEKVEMLEQLSQYNLSKREEEVLGFIGQGLNNEEIANTLFVSKNTIKTHIKNIYSKLNVKNRVQAMKKMV